MTDKAQITFEEIDHAKDVRYGGSGNCRWPWSELTEGGPAMIIPPALFNNDDYEKQKIRASAWMYAKNHKIRFKTYTRKDGAIIVERVSLKEHPVRKNKKHEQE